MLLLELPALTQAAHSYALLCCNMKFRYTKKTTVHCTLKLKLG